MDVFGVDIGKFYRGRAKILSITIGVEVTWALYATVTLCFGVTNDFLHVES